MAAGTCMRRAAQRNPCKLRHVSIHPHCTHHPAPHRVLLLVGLAEGVDHQAAKPLAAQLAAGSSRGAEGLAHASAAQRNPVPFWQCSP